MYHTLESLSFIHRGDFFPPESMAAVHILQTREHHITNATMLLECEDTKFHFKTFHIAYLKLAHLVSEPSQKIRRRGS